MTFSLMIKRYGDGEIPYIGKSAEYHSGVADQTAFA